jgi:hypothetical protein
MKTLKLSYTNLDPELIGLKNLYIWLKKKNHQWGQFWKFQPIASGVCSTFSISDLVVNTSLIFFDSQIPNQE